MKIYKSNDRNLAWRWPWLSMLRRFNNKLCLLDLDLLRFERPAIVLHFRHGHERPELVSLRRELRSDRAAIDANSTKHLLAGM